MRFLIHSILGIAALFLLGVAILVVVVGGITLRKQLLMSQMDEVASTIPTVPGTKVETYTNRSPIFQLFTDHYNSDNVGLVNSYKDPSISIVADELVTFYRTFLLENGWNEISGDENSFRFRKKNVNLTLYIPYFGSQTDWVLEFSPAR